MCLGQYSHKTGQIAGVLSKKPGSTFCYFSQTQIIVDCTLIDRSIQETSEGLNYLTPILRIIPCRPCRAEIFYHYAKPSKVD